MPATTAATIQPRRQYGTAILSEHRISEWTNTLLPRPEGGEQRGLLEARIRVRGLPVRVFNTHLQHDSQVERLAQIAAIRDVLAGTDESVVLLGDLTYRFVEVPLDSTWRVPGTGTAGRPGLAAGVAPLACGAACAAPLLTPPPAP